MSNMITKKFKLDNAHGLHTRAADAFVKCASRHASDIKIRYKDRCANGKSILAVLTLGAGKESEIECKDEVTALNELGELIEKRFHEREKN
jgi:phosphotransferase system HPr (HPr) family protein